MNSRVKNLYNLQDKILESLSKFSDRNNFPFNLSGGTALVRFYAKKPYRISYDLDFFSISSIKNFKFTELSKFLQECFEEIEHVNYLWKNTPIYRLNIYDKDYSVKVEFIEDLFSGAFVGYNLNDLNIKIEPIHAIYTRKIWAFISSLENKEIVWDRLKDILDLIELENIYIEFEKFFINEFKEIAEQNGINISTGKMLSYFFMVEEIIMNNYNVFEILTKEDYRCILNLNEVLNWLRKKQTALKYVQDK